MIKTGVVSNKFSVKKELELKVGPLLYMPALKEDISSKLISLRKSGLLSAALCLEDTIRDDMVEKAEDNLSKELKSIYESLCAGETAEEDLPMIFVRVRSASQIKKLIKKCGEPFDIISGLILPKIDDITIIPYLEALSKTENAYPIMPIIENPSLLNPARRQKKLDCLYKTLSAVIDRIINIRVGGNDFSNAVGLCSDIDHTIYDLLPVSALLSDICAFFSPDFTVSAPVWNYFEGERWERMMIKEMEIDKCCGFFGKTIIHPNQISVALEGMKVLESEYIAAKKLLSSDGEIQVIKSGGRMYENKVHSGWAEKVLNIARIYGVKQRENIL